MSGVKSVYFRPGLAQYCERCKYFRPISSVGHRDAAITSWILDIGGLACQGRAAPYGSSENRREEQNDEQAWALVVGRYPGGAPPVSGAEATIWHA